MFFHWAVSETVLVAVVLSNVNTSVYTALFLQLAMWHLTRHMNIEEPNYNSHASLQGEPG
jgi:hypothetical protein